MEKNLNNDHTLSSRTDLSPSDNMELVRMIVGTTVFSYKGQLYKQSSGFPMGSGISPGACNTFMETYEREALESCPEDNRPHKLFRYVVDVAEVIK